MRAYLTAIAGIMTLLFISCSGEKLDGKIEKRDVGDYYIVNTSKTKAFRFTVKATETDNDSTRRYKIVFFDLAPGDEEYIGKEIVELTEDSFKDSLTSGSNAPRKVEDWGEEVYSKDSTVAQKKPIIQVFKYEYSLTGQIDIKEKKEVE